MHKAPRGFNFLKDCYMSYENVTLTPDQYVISKIIEYPSLYVTTSLECSRQRIFDQLLNVIGNGITDDCALKQEVYGIPVIPVDLDKFFTENWFYGYEHVREIDVGDHTLIFPDSVSKSISCRESEKANHPEIKLWIKIDTSGSLDTLVPYPNFKKQYSTVWRTDYKSLGQEWIDSAVCYYELAKTALINNELKYPYAYPKETPEKTRACEENQLQYFGDRTYAEISAAWGHPYDGDIEKFLLTKWKKEQQEIFDFINETIQYLREPHETFNET